MFGDEQREKEHEADTRGTIASIAIFGLIFAGLWQLQDNLLNYKIMTARGHEAVMMDANSPAPLSSELVFLTGVLVASSIPKENVSQVPISDAAAVRTITEQYQCRRARRSGRSCSWNTQGQIFSIGAPVRVGQIGMASQLFEKNGEELWVRGLSESDVKQIVATRMLLERRGPYLYQGNRTRFSHRIIKNNQTITAIGALQNRQLTPSPWFTPTYPALWHGEMTPELYEHTLRARLQTFILASVAAFTIGIWLALLFGQWALVGRSGVPGGVLALIGFVSSTSALAFFFFIPNFWLAGGVMLVSALSALLVARRVYA